MLALGYIIWIKLILSIIEDRILPENIIIITHKLFLDMADVHTVERAPFSNEFMLIFLNII